MLVVRYLDVETVEACTKNKCERFRELNLVLHVDGVNRNVGFGVVFQISEWSSVQATCVETNAGVVTLANLEIFLIFSCSCIIKIRIVAIIF